MLCCRCSSFVIFDETFSNVLLHIHTRMLGFRHGSLTFPVPKVAREKTSFEVSLSELLSDARFRAAKSATSLGQLHLLAHKFIPPLPHLMGFFLNSVPMVLHHVLRRCFLERNRGEKSTWKTGVLMLVGMVLPVPALWHAGRDVFDVCCPRFNWYRKSHIKSQQTYQTPHELHTWWHTQLSNLAGLGMLDYFACSKHKFCNREMAKTEKERVAWKQLITKYDTHWGENFPIREGIGFVRKRNAFERKTAPISGLFNSVL